MEQRRMHWTNWVALVAIVGAPLVVLNVKRQEWARERINAAAAANATAYLQEQERKRAANLQESLKRLSASFPGTNPTVKEEVEATGMKMPKKAAEVKATPPK